MTSAIIATWLTVMVAIESPWLRWENTAGQPAARLEAWPAGTAIVARQAPAAKRLVVFVHPKCACTKSTLRVLEQTAAHRADTDVRVVVWRPPGSDWTPQTTLPLYFDEGGAETKRFGVTTSGHVMAFDARTGAVLFSGGITDTRGGAEPGKGAGRLAAALNSGTLESAPGVYGCSFSASS